MRRQILDVRDVRRVRGSVPHRRLERRPRRIHPAAHWYWRCRSFRLVSFNRKTAAMGNCDILNYHILSASWLTERPATPRTPVQQFWARGYWVSTVGRDEGAVRRYIQEQAKEAQ